MSPFDLGRKYYEAGRYARALEAFAQAVASSTEPSVRNKSYYYQGLVLFELGHYYSSYVSFRNVLLTADEKSKEVYEKAIKNAVLITDRLNMVERVGKAIDRLPPSFIPSASAGHANFAQGVYHFSIGDESKASQHFKSVNPENPFHSKALFYLGILATRTKNYKEAIYYFERVVTLNRGKRDKASLAQSDLARLNLARSVYSSGDMERSIEMYSQFTSSSPHWVTILLEASWPLLRVNDTTVSLGNLHTVLSPFYREDLVGEGYILRATILYSLCKYDEMKKTLSNFFQLYDPTLRAMQAETGQLSGGESFYRAFVTKKGLNKAFIGAMGRDEGVQNSLKILEQVRDERSNVSRLGRTDQVRKLVSILEETEREMASALGNTLQKLHRRKLEELIQQREQANYLKVEIITAEKELIEGQRGLPPKRVVDVETSVASAYHFWPFVGEYWEDELGAYVYTTESSCVN